MTPCVLLGVLEETFALPMPDIAEVASATPVTRVPGLPPWLRGLTGWRGRLLAVADLSLLLGQQGGVADGPVVVVRRGAAELGLACTGVLGTVDLDLSELTPPARGIPLRVAALLLGQLVTEEAETPRTVAVLNAGALLALRADVPAREAARLVG